MHEQNIFVVDDDVATRSALDTMLRSVGYQVQLFGSGQELLDVLGDGIDACIILDVRLPGPSGLEVQRRLAEKGLATPVIFMTGHGDIPMAVQAMKADAVEFLTKPVRDQDVLDAIDVALARNSARRDRERARADAVRRIDTLSRRELEVFLLLCQGRLTKQIAPELGMSQATVKVHRRNIINNLGVQSLGEMLLLHAASQ